MRIMVVGYTSVYAATLEKDMDLHFPLGTKRHAWLQVTRGSLLLNDVSLSQGDGCAVSHEDTLALKAQKPSEVLLFDLG